MMVFVFNVVVKVINILVKEYRILVFGGGIVGVGVLD